MDFPGFNPVALQLGPLAIRWYALAYLFGFVGGWRYGVYLAGLSKEARPNKTDIDDFVPWAITGVILGGRLGYILFYNFSYYMANLGDVLKVWQGGMSFHGGFLGVVIATILFCKKHKLAIFPLFDLAACAAPIGLFFGRIANFINGELYGRVTDSSLGMIFPNGGLLPRYPSQIFEATLEGLLPFLLLFYVANFTSLKARTGLLSGIFVCCYGAARIGVENFREPDVQIGYLFGGITTGQLLSLPMIIIGIFIIIIAARRKNVA